MRSVEWIYDFWLLTYYVPGPGSRVKDLMVVFFELNTCKHLCGPRHFRDFPYLTSDLVYGWVHEKKARHQIPRFLEVLMANTIFCSSPLSPFSFCNTFIQAPNSCMLFSLHQHHGLNNLKALSADALLISTPVWDDQGGVPHNVAELVKIKNTSSCAEIPPSVCFPCFLTTFDTILDLDGWENSTWLSGPWSWDTKPTYDVML